MRFLLRLSCIWVRESLWKEDQCYEVVFFILIFILSFILWHLLKKKFNNKRSFAEFFFYIMIDLFLIINDGDFPAGHGVREILNIPSTSESSAEGGRVGAGDSIYIPSSPSESSAEDGAVSTPAGEEAFWGGLESLESASYLPPEGVRPPTEPPLGPEDRGQPPLGPVLHSSLNREAGEGEENLLLWDLVEREASPTTGPLRVTETGGPATGAEIVEVISSPEGATSLEVLSSDSEGGE